MHTRELQLPTPFLYKDGKSPQFMHTRELQPELSKISTTKVFPQFMHTRELQPQHIVFQISTRAYVVIV